MSDNKQSPALPTYEELVNGALNALNIATAILTTADQAASEEEAQNIVATAHLTVAGAQVFATLAAAAAEREGTLLPMVEATADWQRRPPFRPTLVPDSE